MNTSSDWSDRCYGYAPVHLEYCCNTPCMFPPPATSRTAWATSYRPTVSEEPCYLWPIRRLRSPFAPESKREADQSSKRTALFILKNSRNLTHTYLRFGHFHSSVLKHCNRFEEKCTNMRNTHTLVRVHTYTHTSACCSMHAQNTCFILEKEMSSICRDYELFFSFFVLWMSFWFCFKQLLITWKPGHLIIL